MRQGAEELAKLSVLELLRGALYDPERGSSLVALVEEIGDVVERSELLARSANAFPDVAAHPGFATEEDACLALIGSTLDLLPWQDSWLVTQESVLLELRDSLRGVEPGTVPRQLKRAGPTLTDHHALITALLREMPDDVEEVERSAGVGTRAQKSATRRAARPSPTKRIDPRWRPVWWHDLRSWSAEHGFALERITPSRQRRLAAYVDGIRELLDSDEALHAVHWKRSFSRSAAPRMSEVERIDVHAHIVTDLVDRFVRSTHRTTAELAGEYESLTRKAFLLGMADHVVDMALHPGAATASTVALEPGMRIGATVGPGIPLNEVLAVHEQVEAHAAALGLTTGGVARATQLLAVTGWDLKSRAVAKALRYRIPLVLMDDLLEAGMREELESRIVTFPASRAAVCGKCGILHTLPGRRVHRLDALCDGCR
jgi:hypothetical protein